jgi:fatty-acyl-CoA synthase
MNVPLTPIRFKRRAASLYGRKIGVICEGLRLTYQELFRRCDRLSHMLMALGVQPGDRVAFLAFNCHRLLEAYYGVVQTGAILLPINVRLSKEEIAFILNDSEARILFFTMSFGRA